MMRIHFCFVVVVLLFVVACGPVEYMGQVGIRGSKELAAASEIKADKHAPYEYWSAYCYLKRAREKAGYGDYGDANRYGRKSELMSRNAQKMIRSGQLAENPNENENDTSEPSVPKKKPVVVLDSDTPSGD